MKNLYDLEHEFAALSEIVFPDLDGRKDISLSSPTHVTTKPATTFFLRCFSFLDIYAIGPIVSGRNKIL